MAAAGKRPAAAVAVVSERPRLSGALRAFLTDRADFDLESAYVERLQIIQRRLRSAGISDGPETPGWSWKEFARGVEGRADEREVRRKFERFVQVGGEISGEAMDAGTAAQMAYDVVNANPDDPPDAKASVLREFFAGCTPAAAKEAVKLAGELHAWRTGAAAAGPAPAARGGPLMDREWGEDLPELRGPPPAPPPPPRQRLRGPAAAPPDAGSGGARGGGEGAGGMGGEVGRELVLRCEDHCSRAGGLFSPLELAEQLLETLNKPASAGRRRPGRGGGRREGPALGSQVVVQSESERLMGKLRRKEEKRAARRAGAGDGPAAASAAAEFLAAAAAGAESDPRTLREQRERDLREAPARAAALLGTGTVGGGVQKMALPEGTVSKKFKGYEEVHIPPSVPSAMGGKERLVPIAEMDDWARPAFHGMRCLNRIQSRLYPAAYRSNENLLVCAPTGAGKTNIAMLAILHEVGQHIVRGALARDEFKIIYVAPMKALAAEVVEKFSERLAPLSMTVKELTGDMQLTRKELQETQVIVTTPEKWDVITRKTSDTGLVSLVRLLIIDEVHLLADDRGPVIETLVARTLRMVESTQSMIRIVGLSATLPNYRDVAVFLRVNPETGLYYFDNSYRPVPLAQQFIGVSEANGAKRLQLIGDICYMKVLESLQRGHQVMVFVHSRKDTGKTARMLRELAQRDQKTALFLRGKALDEGEDEGSFTDEAARRLAALQRELGKSRNTELKDVGVSGIGLHHAGMLRSDRNIVERLFASGHLRVLCCTATLAWGVNLPAHTVVIKGTQVYDAQKGTFTELSMLDVMQIFGRAGRPQYDTSGEAILITAHDKLKHYLDLLNHAMPIESQFIKKLADHLNAECVLGTVTNVREACEWISYTYLYVRMMRNPMVYGITYHEKEMDPSLSAKRRELVELAAKRLHACQMLRFGEKSGALGVTELGRVASHYYIENETVEAWNERLKQHMTEAELISLVAAAHEFAHVQTRDDELPELERLLHEACEYPPKHGLDAERAKTSILLQAYVARAFLESFTLITDTAYIVQSAGRICRALFEIVRGRGWTSLTDKLLTLCKCIERRVWPDHTPLRQFEILPPDVIVKLETRGATVERLRDMSEAEVGRLVSHPAAGPRIAKLVRQFPALALSPLVQPITRTVLRVVLTITAEFEWNERQHGSAEGWWIWVEDAENEHIYHSEYFLLHRKAKEEAQTLDFTVPLFEPMPPQYFVRAVSDRWLHAEAHAEIALSSLILPEKHPPQTDLLDLAPLPRSALQDPTFESLYTFSHFNPVQTQVFHTLYHTDVNVLLGAPTGSGKTVVAELAMLRVFREHPGRKVIYIGPLKALVRERMEDWKVRLAGRLGKGLVELTGDVTPDLHALLNADVICTTPEKWDGVSRHWQNRSYVKKVGLVIIDEIHLLGGDRGPILEVIVSRMRYISSQTAAPVRFVGLSTAMANARDLADWLAIDTQGLFNFRPAVRPVPLEVHVQGFPGKHYCPRMATMNKPTYASIVQHAGEKPALVFVSSRRQTRLTALDLVAFAAADERPRRFLRMAPEELEGLLEASGVRDASLKHTLAFGIGLHHAGLHERDKALVEELFVNEKIQVLVSTSTLAWGVNFPAHLVVVKGTEYYDAKTRRYVDYPITDVLQMMGRAGRPQFDATGVAVVLLHGAPYPLPAPPSHPPLSRYPPDAKKNFYKKFLYEPFPVESSLPAVLHNHLNAEAAAGTIASRQDALDYLTWTYFFRRLVMNPSFYHLQDASRGGIERHLSALVERATADLQHAGCLELEGDALRPTTLGRVASFYYLDYRTAAMLHQRLGAGPAALPELLEILCAAEEYAELPVRHNEDALNLQLAKAVPWGIDPRRADSPHVKACLLLQAHFARAALPVADYATDTKAVLDNSVRILQAMLDVAADCGALDTALQTLHLSQMVMQGRFLGACGGGLACLPHVEREHLPALAAAGAAAAAARLPSVSVRWRLEPRVPRPGTEAAVVVEVTRESRSSLKIATGRFPKPKDEGWFAVVGNPSFGPPPSGISAGGELVALKRLALRPGSTTRAPLRFLAPPAAGRHRFTLYLVSDAYVGLDQQYDVPFDVADAPEPAPEAGPGAGRRPRGAPPAPRYDEEEAAAGPGDDQEGFEGEM
eukprot:tig00021238_g19554.t1